MSDAKLHAVILAGGSGTRFWPLSREQLPKQLLPIAEARSMLALTLERALLLVPEESVWVVTTRSQGVQIRRELANLGRSRVRVIEEPSARNTAAAIGLAAIHVARQDADAILAVFPADHHVQKPDQFAACIRQASELAGQGWLLTLGIRPSRPETGYGYIHRGAALPRAGSTAGASAYRVAGFTEKPGLQTARSYLENGDYDWNSGMFVWRADRFLEELGRHLPEHHRALLEIGSLLREPDAPRERIDALYSGLPPVSVDYGVMERADRVAVIPAEMGWSDVGSWQSLREILEKDEDGNILQGDVLALGTRNCLVRAEGRLVATLGVDGLVVVDTPDALLVCGETHSQDVKQIAERLRALGRPEAVAPRKVLKPWGAYRVLEAGGDTQVKEILVNPGHRLSLQSHRWRNEHWVVVAGTATVTVDDRVLEVPFGASAYIPAGSRHRAENRGEEPLRFIEVQTGTYLGEDDIVRYEDDYGRTGSVS